MITPTDYPRQLADKADRMTRRFARFQPPELEVFASPETHYRMRAEFRVWHEGDDLYYIMFDPQTKQKYRVDQFPAASTLINRAMPRLIEALKHSEPLRRKLFQVDFLSTLSGELLISLLYHKQLNDAWTDAARQLKAELGKTFKVDIIGRARKQKISLDREHVIETLAVNGRTYHYQQVENSFTQPNARINEAMLGWALDCTRDSQGDLLELYCGNGNFSLVLAQQFDKVLATEIAKPSVDAAQYNIEVNGVDNLKILRLSAEEFTEAMTGRPFRRLAQAGVELSDYRCNTIFVDPPRAGLDADTLNMVQQYPNILYISCNPDTLEVNLDTLSQTHAIRRLALFDQFPYTHHMECGVLLCKRAP